LTDLLISAMNISEAYSLLIRASDSQGNFDFEVFDGIWTLGSWAGGPPSDLLPQVSATVTNQTDRDGVILRGLSRERYLNCSVTTENGEPLLNMAIQADHYVNGLRYMDQAATEIDGRAF